MPLILAAALLSAVLAAPSAHAAGTWQCSASALSGTVLGQPLEPVTANAAAPDCRTATSSLGASLPVALDAQAVVASTKAGARDALAVGGVADLRVRALPELPIALPEVPIPAEFGAVEVPLTGLVATLLGRSSITIDIRPALQALVPDRQLPTLDLLRVQTAVAYAAGQCVDGRARVAGASHVAGISVLGQELPTGRLVDRTLTLLDTGSIDPSDIDLALIDLSSLGLTDVTRPLVHALIDPVLDTLPTVAIPATLAQVKVTPGAQTTEHGVVTQRALRVEVGVAGQSLADLTLGRATAGESGVDCSVERVVAAPPATSTDLALECTRRRLVLIDVLRRGNRVKLLGAADRKLAGRTVDLVFDATGRRVARAVVQADGSFAATAPLPARRLRSTNRARYRAVVGREKSLNLKLERRMVVSSMRSRNGKVTIRGRVIRPLASPRAKIQVRRRLSCKRDQVVATVRPSADGRFRVTVAAPTGKSAAVYRLATRVRRTASNPKTFPTFTLPRAVDLDR